MAKTFLLQGLRRAYQIGRFAQRRNLSSATALELWDLRINMPYKSLVNKLMPQAEVVRDRFHIMGQINDELDRERRRIKRESE